MNATLTGLWPGDVHQRHNPVGVVIFSRRLTQGGSFLATLGFEAESLWDSWTARLALQETEMRPCLNPTHVIRRHNHHPAEKDRQQHRQLIGYKGAFVQKSACKQAFYVLYLIGNNIGINDHKSRQQNTLRSAIGHGAALARNWRRKIVRPVIGAHPGRR